MRKTRYPNLKTRLLANSLKTSCGCLIWLGPINKGGYGKITIRNAKGIPQGFAVHRLAYEVYNGVKLRKKDYDKVVAHTCHVSLCLARGHLTLKTQRDNIQDAIRNGKHQSLVNKRESEQRAFLDSLATEDIKWPWNPPQQRRRT